MLNLRQLTVLKCSVIKRTGALMVLVLQMIGFSTKAQKLKQNFMVQTFSDVKTIVSRDKVTGNTISITHQGLYKGCGVPVGTDSIFHSNGKLNTTHTYKHFSPKQNGSCHELITHRITLQYYNSGQIKSKQEYAYCYECEPKPYGVWDKYAQNGKLTESKRVGKVQ